MVAAATKSAVAGNIRVVVLEIKGGQVRLGIEAPNSVQVHRDEVYARILDENKQAALTEVRTLPPLMTFNGLIKRKT